MEVGGWPETIAAFAVGSVTTAGIWLKKNGTREGRFNARYDKRFDELEAKVEQCERERPFMLIMAWGMKAMVADAQERDRCNPVLKQVAAAFKALPATEHVGINELLAQLNTVEWDGPR